MVFFFIKYADKKVNLYSVGKSLTARSCGIHVHKNNMKYALFLDTYGIGFKLNGIILNTI